MDLFDILLIGFIGIIFIFIVIMSIVIVRPRERGLIERFGKYNRFLEPGLHFRIPFVELAYGIDITERMVDAEPQEVITQDNLNAKVDAQVYFKVKTDEASIKKSQYAVNDYELQIVALARTTLRDIIGKMVFKDVNNKREILNNKLAAELDKQTDAWGIEVVRTELKEIEPPRNVQETMNKVLIAENEKTAAVDFATATETRADGERRAAIKIAEGEAQAVKIRADGEATAIQVVNEAAQKFFVGNAIELRKLEALEKTLSANTKIIVPNDAPLIDLIVKLGELKGVKK